MNDKSPGFQTIKALISNLNEDERDDLFMEEMNKLYMRGWEFLSQLFALGFVALVLLDYFGNDFNNFKEFIGDDGILGLLIGVFVFPILWIIIGMSTVVFLQLVPTLILMWSGKASRRLIALRQERHFVGVTIAWFGVVVLGLFIVAGLWGSLWGLRV